MTLTVEYKLRKGAVNTINVPNASTVGDLLIAVNKKHHLKLQYVYYVKESAICDLEDPLDGYSDSLFFYIDNDQSFNAEDFKDDDVDDAKDYYPKIPILIDYPKVDDEKHFDPLLETGKTNPFKLRYKIQKFPDHPKADVFYVYSTKDYQSMTIPTEIKIPLSSTYDSTEKAIRKALNIPSDLQIHIYLTSGAPFPKKYGPKKTDNKLANFFNSIDSKHILYAIITRPIPQKLLDSIVQEVCCAANENMKLLISPMTNCSEVGYSRMACLLGTFYYKGIKTYSFINSIARCTGFAPLVSCLTSMMYHDPINGLMYVTVTASLHCLFSHLLTDKTKKEAVFDRCLECACYVVRAQDSYENDNKGKDKDIYRNTIIVIEKKEESVGPFDKYLINCEVGGAFYEYAPDISDKNDYEVTVLERPSKPDVIKKMFPKFASFKPLPPLSTRMANLTCIIQYVNNRTLLFLGDFNEDESEDTLNIIDPFVGKIQKANVNKLSEEVAKYTNNSESLIDSDEVEDLIVILLDKSGSMIKKLNGKIALTDIKDDKTKKDPTDPKHGLPVVADTNRILIARQFILSFINRSFGFRLPQLISLISFNENSTIECDFTPLGPIVEQALDKVQTKGDSKIWDALDFSIDRLLELNKNHQYPNAKLRVLIFSDGDDSGSTKKKEEVCQRAINSNIVVDSIILSTIENCINLGKLSHFTGGYSFRSEDVNEINSLFEKEAFLSFGLRSAVVLPSVPITEKLFNDATFMFDQDCDNYDFITKTLNTNLSTPNYVMSLAKRERPLPSDRYYIRLLKELKKIQLEKDETIKVYVRSGNIKSWKVYLKGPEGTRYAKKWWYLSITFTEAYPLQPPLFRFISIPYHINISEDGRVCASFLYKMYKSSFSVLELINKVKNLLKNPEEKSPIQIFKMMMYKYDKVEFNERIDESCEDAHDSVKGYIGKIVVNDDPKFKVSKNDFEGNSVEDDMDAELNNIFNHHEVVTDYEGFALISSPIDDSD